MLLEPIRRNKDVHVFLKQAPFHDMIIHASAFLADRKEVLGLLIGREKGAKQLIIERIIPITEGSESSVQLQEPEFAIYERLFLDEAAGEFVLGWYHSHPFWGLFLSHIDIETHSLAFQLRYPKAIALVIDPALIEDGDDSKALEIFRVINPKNWTTFEYETVAWTIENGNSDPESTSDDNVSLR
ncbi:MAG: Mov34/MPN/PAD-1 family protein [Candidatus Hodarchaeales archaeon]|jgi:proteasome lid subunit RPN8/RPN11